MEEMFHGIKKDPDTYVGKEYQTIDNVLSLADEKPTLREVLENCDHYAGEPEGYITEMASVILYAHIDADAEIHRPDRLITIPIPLDGFDNAHDAIVAVKEQLQEIEIMKLHENELVDSIHNSFYICDKQTRSGEYTFGIYLL